MTDCAAVQSLLDSIERYFDLMYDWDTSRFDAVFAPSAQLHGFRDGNLRILPARDYMAILAAGPSPRIKNAPRQQEILLVDLASATQAVAKVQVRINLILYLDYLAYHLIEGNWLITAKSFHVALTYDETAA